MKDKGLCKDLKVPLDKVLQAAEECEEFKVVAKKLWPNEFIKRDIDVTHQIIWTVDMNRKSVWLHGEYKGKNIVHAHPDGMYIETNEACRYEIRGDKGKWQYFQIFKLGK